MDAIKSLHQKLIDYAGNLSNKTILDYGCGRGGMLELLLQYKPKPRSITAVDSSEKMVLDCTNRFKQFISTEELIVAQCSEPNELSHSRFDIIFCHNVLECVENKETFVRGLFNLLSPGGTFILSHHDFDSAIYNSEFKDVTRNLVHCFADTKQSWQNYHDGQIGRKISGIITSAGIKHASICTWRVVETSFDQEDYGYLMCKMILDVCKNKFTQSEVDLWQKDLQSKAQNGAHYFAIDVVVAKMINT